MLKDQLQHIFSNDYPGSKVIAERVFKPIFKEGFNHLSEEFTISQADIDANILSIKRIGEIPAYGDVGHYEIQIYDVTISDNVSIERSRVNIQSSIRSKLYYNHAFIIFHYSNPNDRTWRLSYVYKEEKGVTEAKRYTYLLGKSCSARTVTENFVRLSESNLDDKAILNAFSVEALTKEFYDKLFKWYLWATDEKSGVTFPNDPTTADDDRDSINVKIIRLITRLLFCWFIKQKNLIPDELFSEAWCSDNLQDFTFGIGNNAVKYDLGEFNPSSMTSGNYYAAVLQNLFFSTLNTEIGDRAWANGSSTSYKDRHYGVKNLLRDNHAVSFFKGDGKAEFVALLRKIPYLNGGLFECQDKETYSDTSSDNRVIYYDGFSRDNMRQKRAFIPNALFFNPESRGDEMGIFTIFSQYNFTVDENTTDDIQISLDPELLGKVFENLLASYNPETKETARKQTGSFYTPRIIVDYMVNESLISYLGGSDSVRDFIVSGVTTDIPSDIADRLKSVKIIDPACGSGAFPMGCLLKITSLLQLLEPEKSNYDRKLEIISNCIYGVDIQPIAMLISKLRFFISLLCDQDSIDFDKPEENFGINPLPNLETKFVAANSLCTPIIRKFSDKDEEWFDSQLKQLKDELNEIRRHQFKVRTRTDKLNLRHQDRLKCDEIRHYIKEQCNFVDDTFISRCEEEIQKLTQRLSTEPVQSLMSVEASDVLGLFGEKIRPAHKKLSIVDNHKEIKKQISALNATIKKERDKAKPRYFEQAVDEVTRWNPYDQNVSSPFFDPEWMFGVKDGFDIVIGNPPYVQLQANGGELRKLYENCGFETFVSTGDLYSLFYERGWQLLSQQGILCFITSNKWMRAGYGEATRRFFATKTNPEILIDFAGTKIFDSATVDTNILLFSKGDNKGMTKCCAVNKSNGGSLSNMSNFVQQNAIFSDFSKIESESWVILSDIERSIKAKIEKAGTPLKDWDIQINYGIKTGFNEAFIITTEKRNEILASCSTVDERHRTDELIRPILRGKDIKRYSYNKKAGMWLINTHNGIHGKKERIYIEDYPAVKAHLDKYWDKISNRADKGDTPYNLRNCAYIDDFNKPKIIYPNMTKYLPFMFDDKKFLTNQKCFIITGEGTAYLTAFFNSSLFKYCFRDSFPELQGGTREMSKIFFDKIPVKKISKKQEEHFKNIVSDIQLEYSKEKAIYIDHLIFDIYNLSEQERKAIGFQEIQ